MPIFLFAVLPPGSEATVYSRMFAPEFGIIEDPATGGATGPLGCYLVEHGLVAPGAAQLDAEPAGRGDGPAQPAAHLDRRRPVGITGVRVGGEAVLVGRGELYV